MITKETILKNLIGAIKQGMIVNFWGEGMTERVNADSFHKSFRSGAEAVAWCRDITSSVGIARNDTEFDVLCYPVVQRSTQQSWRSCAQCNWSLRKLGDVINTLQGICHI